MSDVEPRRGMIFLHAYQIVGSPKLGTHRPASCVVTRVTATSVYFRSETGFLSVIDRHRFPNAVKEVQHP